MYRQIALLRSDQENYPLFSNIESNYSAKFLTDENAEVAEYYIFLLIPERVLSAIFAISAVNGYY